VTDKQQNRLRLIADPEEKNDDRADWAYEALCSFQSATGLGDEDGLDTAVSDLLADIAHLCDRERLDFSHLILRAKNHYEAETEPDNGDADEGERGTQFDHINVTED